MGEIYTLVFIILSWFFALVVVIQVMVILDNDSSVKNFFTNYLKGLLTWSTIWLVIALCVNTLGAPEVPWALENEAAQLIRVALSPFLSKVHRNALRKHSPSKYGQALPRRLWQPSLDFQLPVNSQEMLILHWLRPHLHLSMRRN